MPNRQRPGAFAISALDRSHLPGCLQNAVDSVARHAANSRATSLRGIAGILMRASPRGKSKTMERDGVRMSSISRIGVLSGMALLWVIVAVLQYKWATQLSAATEVRIGSNLQSLMTRWQRDLYDELSAVCVAMQVGPDSGAHDAWNDYLQRYAEWNGNEKNSDVPEGAYPNPDLVREIYDWQTSARGTPELLRLNPNAKVL